MGMRLYKAFHLSLKKGRIGMKERGLNCNVQNNHDHHDPPHSNVSMSAHDDWVEF